MGVFLFWLFLLLVILCVLFGLGIGTGFLLHAILPSIDFGIATLIGVVGNGFALYFVAKLMNYVTTFEDPYDLETRLLDVEVLTRTGPRSSRKSRSRKT